MRLGNSRAPTWARWTFAALAATAAALALGSCNRSQTLAVAPAIVVSPAVPGELNPPAAGQTGGAPNATPDQAADFAWQEFIALNWPAGPQQGQPGQRDTPSTTLGFGAPGYAGPLVWETFRGKVEIFPGNVNPFKVVAPPGYPGPPGDKSFGYDALPVYNYSSAIPSCDPQQANDPTPWVNLDETDQITLDNMYAGVVGTGDSPGNSAPQLVRFLAKANRTHYAYVAGASDPSDPSKLWWATIPASVVAATKTYLSAHKASPPAGSKDMVSLPYGTIEVKAGWRPLTAAEKASGRFHTQTVRFYEAQAGGFQKCWTDAVWGLVALHIIQKTPSAPYFIYATFEQADNLLSQAGAPIEDVDGRESTPAPATATTPQVCLVDPQPPKTPPPAGGEVTSALGQVVLTNDPATCKPAPAAYCGTPGSRLYYRNLIPPPNNAPDQGNICVNRRDNPIPQYVVQANAAAHQAIAAYLKSKGVASAPWLYYKLVNVQYYPYDKIPDPGRPNGSPYTAKPPFTARNPAPSSYYQANIVVETNRALQMFSGGLSPNISTDWNADGTPHKNSYYGGQFYNMGGCMGCHGSQGQNPGGQAGDFSVILARGTVSQPESPTLEMTSLAARAQAHNRSLKR
ncbi:MAG TPA: hypothetical protein VG939_09225 [Caulobacteraceae bacterium]|nr:hypothetical protein [Caulobacteraceae bacterium]